MAHLLHIDSSFQGDASVSRRLSARAADRWRSAHPGGAVTYRDLGSEPVPHLETATALARMIPEDQRTPEQELSWQLSLQLIGEIQAADTVILGLPLYNFGPPSSVKAWVDHLVAPGVSFDPVTKEPFLGGRDLLVVASRGGGYGAGTPREGWDHAEQWLPHGVDMLGLEPRFITAELTLADVEPAMAGLKDLAAQSLADAEAEIDRQWTGAAVS